MTRALEALTLSRLLWQLALHQVALVQSTNQRPIHTSQRRRTPMKGQGGPEDTLPRPRQPPMEVKEPWSSTHQLLTPQNILTGQAPFQVPRLYSLLPQFNILARFRSSIRLPRRHRLPSPPEQLRAVVLRRFIRLGRTRAHL